MHRVLSVIWDTTDDTIFVQPKLKVTNTTTSSLRPVLFTEARVFDPLGILATFVKKLRYFFQNLCKSVITLDENVPSDFDNWQLCLIIDNCVNQCEQVLPVRLPRWLGAQLSLIDIQLQVFCDASQDAMTKCIFFTLAYTLLLWLAEQRQHHWSKRALRNWNYKPPLWAHGCACSLLMKCQWSSTPLNFGQLASLFCPGLHHSETWKVIAQKYLVKFLFYATPNNGNISLVNSSQHPKFLSSK